MARLTAKVHGALDYVMGLALVLTPTLFRFDDDTLAMWVPVMAGAGTIAYSAITSYRAGVFPVIPLRQHLRLDLAVGILLLAAPALLEFPPRAWAPVMLMGLLYVGGYFFTEASTVSPNQRSLPKPVCPPAISVEAPGYASRATKKRRVQSSRVG